MTLIKRNAFLTYQNAAVQTVSGGDSSNDCPPCPGPENGPTVLCPPHTCPPGQHFDPKVNKCVPDVITCPKDQHYDTKQKKCIPDNCPPGQHFDPKLNKCVPNPTCKKDERYDPTQNKCVRICPIGTELINGKCQQIIHLKLIVHTVVKNSLSTNQPTFLLLLDTAQLCQLAGDTQCVAKQNQFNTLL